MNVYCVWWWVCWAVNCWKSKYFWKGGRQVHFKYFRQLLKTLKSPEFIVNFAPQNFPINLLIISQQNSLKWLIINFQQHLIDLANRFNKHCSCEGMVSHFGKYANLLSEGELRGQYTACGNFPKPMIRHSHPIHAMIGLLCEGALFLTSFSSQFWAILWLTWRIIWKCISHLPSLYGSRLSTLHFKWSYSKHLKALLNTSSD